MERFLMEICFDSDCQAKLKFDTLDQLEKAQKTARNLAKRIEGKRYFFQRIQDYAIVLFECAKIMAKK